MHNNGNRALDAGVPQETIDALDHGANTNWLKAITRTAFSQSHNVSVTGGTNGFTYNAFFKLFKPGRHSN